MADILYKKGATPAEASEAFGPAREEHLRYLTDLYGSYGSYSEFRVVECVPMLAKNDLPDVEHL